MKLSILALFFILLLSFVGCSQEESAAPPLYEQDWVLDLSEYLDVNYLEIDSYLLLDYGLTLIDDQTVLVHEFSKSGRHLVEVDAVNGAFLSKTKMDFALRNIRNRMDGSLLTSGYGAAGSYLLGTYDDNTHAINLISTLEAGKIKDVKEPSNDVSIYTADDVLFSHNPNFAPSDDEVYIAKWNFDGTPIWRKNIDPSNKKKIAKISSIKQDHVLFVSSEFTAFGIGLWSVGKMSKDGDLLWQKQLDDNGYIFDVLENNAGDIFVLNDGGVYKCDMNGGVLWSKNLDQYQGKNIWGNGFATKDGGVLIQLHSNQNEIWMLKLNATGEVVWEEEFWEIQPNNLVSLSFMELPSGDVIVHSTSGYITLYRAVK